MNYNNMGVYNFSIMQGVAHSEVFSGWIINNSPLNLSQAEEVRVDFKRDSKNLHSDLSLSINNGALKIENNNLEFLFGENTTHLIEGIYLYDILIVLEGKRHTYVRGEMTVYPIITK